MAQTLYARALPSQLAAPVDRYINGILSEGVWDLSGNHFQVIEQSTPGMSVRCGSGTAGDMAVVEGDASLQGTYVVQNQDAYVGSGNTDLSISNGDPSDPRIDLVVLRVWDDEMDSSGATKAEVEVVEGAPASSPSAPATPDGAYALASILVPAAESTSIDNADITDLRGQTLIGTGFHTGLHTSPEGVAVGTTVDNAAHAHSSGSTARTVSSTMTIPSHWGGYDVIVEATYSVASTSGTVRRMDHLVSFGGTDSTVRSRRVDDGSSSKFDDTVHQARRFAGLSVTGSQSFGTTLTLNAADSSVTSDEVLVVATAYRTS